MIKISQKDLEMKNIILLTIVFAIFAGTFNTDGQTNRGEQKKMRTALFVVTGHSELGNTGKQTGWYLPEVAHPYFVLRDAGFQIDFASPKGGKTAPDEKSLNMEDADSKRFYEDKNLMAQMADTLKIENISVESYDVIFFAGGHGTMWDFPDDEALSKLAGKIYDRGGIVAAVCHGPAALVNIKLADGKYLIDEKTVNSFTNDEEKAVGLAETVPFLLESKLIERGAKFVKADNFQPFVAVSERLITGQNPMSATAVGKAIVGLADEKTNKNDTSFETKRMMEFETTPQVPRLSTAQLISADAPENVALRKMMTEKPSDPNELKGLRYALLSTDGVEEIEVTAPYKYLQERGATVHLVAPRYQELPAKFGVQFPEMRKTHILTVYFMETAGWFKIDKFLDEVFIEDYDAIIISGGAWNPDTLRHDENVVKFIQDFHKAGRTIAAICHGPQVLINTEILRGKKATAFWNVQIDIKNAGAEVFDEPVVIDENIITSRFPTDLPQFMNAIVEQTTNRQKQTTSGR